MSHQKKASFGMTPPIEFYSSVTVVPEETLDHADICIPFWHTSHIRDEPLK